MAAAAAPASLSRRSAFCFLALYHCSTWSSSRVQLQNIDCIVIVISLHDIYLQDGGGYMAQTVGGPRPELFNQVVFSNHMCSFQ
jgi:hypothetical protein